MLYWINPDIQDEVVSALVGNGELCCTLGPTGYHTPPDLQDEASHKTQRFVMAGRRKSGALHPLINFGYVWRSLRVDDQPPLVRKWEQELIPCEGAVVSLWENESLNETTRSLIALEDNLYLADTVLANIGEQTLSIRFETHYQFGEETAELKIRPAGGVCQIGYSLEEQTGAIQFGAVAEGGECSVYLEERGARSETTATLRPGESVLITTYIHFADRLSPHKPATQEQLEAIAERHAIAWNEFFARSEVVTGHEKVDAFRIMGLYTIRCQATPWSFPTVVSHAYGGGGATCDELYPFLALLGSNHSELVERAPYCRLAGLPSALVAGRGRGASFPQIATENGEEMAEHAQLLKEGSPHAHISRMAATLWQFERSKRQIDDLYPVVREAARYVEANFIVRNASGELEASGRPDRLESCSAAIATLEFASLAADFLGVDERRSACWRRLAVELRSKLASLMAEADSGSQESLSTVFPFAVDESSPDSKRLVRSYHESCRSTRGWKPSVEPEFDFTNWSLCTGTLAVALARQGAGDLAWEALTVAAEAAGNFLSPHEHRDAMGAVRVPWHTPGVGSWIHALNSLFVQVREKGTFLLPAAPQKLEEVSFNRLRGELGVLVSGVIERGELQCLTVRSPRPVDWRFWLPVSLAGLSAQEVVSRDHQWVEFRVGLEADVETRLITD